MSAISNENSPRTPQESRYWGPDVPDSYAYVEVPRNTYAISGDNTKTCFLNSCVGVVLYNPLAKLAGVMHIKESRNLRGVREDLSIATDDLRSIGRIWEQDLIEVHVQGGWDDLDLHENTITALGQIGFTKKYIKTDGYTPHYRPSIFSMDVGSKLGESSPISFMFDPQDGRLHRIIGNLLRSKLTDTGNPLNSLWWGGIRKTPDKRSL